MYYYVKDYVINEEFLDVSNYLTRIQVLSFILMSDSVTT